MPGAKPGQKIFATVFPVTKLASGWGWTFMPLCKYVYTISCPLAFSWELELCFHCLQWISSFSLIQSRLSFYTGGLSIHPLSITAFLVDRQADCQFITRLTHRDKQPFTLTFTPRGNLESPINLHVFGLWEEAREPGENPR